MSKHLLLGAQASRFLCRWYKHICEHTANIDVFNQTKSDMNGEVVEEVSAMTKQKTLQVLMNECLPITVLTE